MSVEFFVFKRQSYSQARRYERVPTQFPVFIHTGSLRIADSVSDISEGGIGIATKEPLPVMSLVSMSMELPHLGAVDVLGRVMWTNDTTMGVRFEQIDPTVVNAVVRLRNELVAI